MNALASRGGVYIFYLRPLPSVEDLRPYGMASDNGRRVWLVETGERSNQFVEFDTGAGKITSVKPIPSGAGSVRHMDCHAPSGSAPIARQLDARWWEKE